MKNIDDVIRVLKHLDDKDLEHLHSVIKFYRRKTLNNKFYELYLEKVNKQIDFVNAAMYIAINQVKSDNPNDGIRKFATSMAEVAKKFLSMFCIGGNITAHNITHLMEYFNYFVLCGEATSAIKKRNKYQINIKGCLFAHNKIFCDFTHKFLFELFALIYPDKMVHINKQFNGSENKNCLFVIEIEDFKHIKILKLE